MRARLPSEVIEPILGSAIEIIFDKWERGDKKSEVRARCFWSKMQALCLVATVNGAPHSVVAMGNYVMAASEMIEEASGFDPIRLGWR